MKRSNKDCVDGKKVCLFYFSKVVGVKKEDGVDFYQCKICPKVQRAQKQGHGWSNLMSHITKDHPNYEEEMHKSNGKIECK